MNRHQRRKNEALARYRYGTKHGSPKVPPAVDESKAKKTPAVDKAGEESEITINP